LLVTWSFLILTVTGIVLYVVPHGRVAYWVQWSLAGMEKDQWGWVHMMFGGVFILSGAAHLYFNWKPFTAFLVGKAKGHLALKREILIATTITVFLFVTSVMNAPPASWVISLNEAIKSSWVSSPELEPPFGHAEQVSLAGLARKLHLELEPAVAELRRRGFAGVDPSSTLEEVARANGTVPMKIYEVIRQYEARPTESVGELTIEELEARYAGTGLGRKTLAELCDIAGVDPLTCLDRLTRAGIAKDLGEQTKSVAEKHDRRPIEILSIVIAP
jgi:hypothetical protein